MERVVVISELGRDAVEAHGRFVDELRTRRSDADPVWRRAGVTSLACWVEPVRSIVIWKLQAPSIDAARAALAAAATPFQRWYRACEHGLFGRSPLDPGEPVAEVLFDHQVEDPDPLDLFMVAAWPLIPDRVEDYRRAVERRDPDDRATRRLRRWHLSRYTVWLQATPTATWAIFDGVGDLAHMLRDLSSAPDPEMELERRFVRDMYGIDLSTTSFDLPRAAWSWTA